jgi:hypothetical protein
VRYGVSYRRALFDEHGLFLEDRLMGEDTEFNARLPVPPVWNRAVVTRHRNPLILKAALADAWTRGLKLHDWMAVQSPHPTSRSLRRIAGALAYGLLMLVRLPAERRGKLLAAAPLACTLALAQAAGALSQAGKRSGANAASRALP